MDGKDFIEYSGLDTPRISKGFAILRKNIGMSNLGTHINMNERRKKIGRQFRLPQIQDLRVTFVLSQKSVPKQLKKVETILSL